MGSTLAVGGIVTAVICVSSVQYFTTLGGFESMHLLTFQWRIGYTAAIKKR